jgi:cytochrome c
MTVKHLLAISTVLVLSACAQESSAPVLAGQAQAPAVSDPAEVAARVAAADPDMGKRQYIFCQACHTVNAGGQNKVGPNLSGIIGRSAGQGAGFVYSDPLTESGLVWDVATLDSWIENPRKLVPGTTMIFGGIKDPSQRANLIAYLHQATQP